MTRTHARFSFKDVSEIVVGSTLLAFPIAITEEVWNLGKEISVFSTVILVLLSLLFLATFSYSTFYQSKLDRHSREFYVRLMAVYFVTLTVAALILALFGEFPLMTEPAVAIKRMIIVALPASFCATVVDSLH